MFCPVVAADFSYGEKTYEGCFNIPLGFLNYLSVEDICKRNSVIMFQLVSYKPFSAAIPPV